MRVRPPLRPLLFAGAPSRTVSHIFATDKDFRRPVSPPLSSAGRRRLAPCRTQHAPSRVLRTAPGAALRLAGHRCRSVWLNDGIGTLVLSGQALGNSGSSHVQLADFDYDGDLDAWVANWETRPIRVWLNDGVGNFTRTQGRDTGCGRRARMLLLVTSSKESSKTKAQLLALVSATTTLISPTLIMMATWMSLSRLATVAIKFGSTLMVTARSPTLGNHLVQIPMCTQHLVTSTTMVMPMHSLRQEAS